MTPSQQEFLRNLDDVINEMITAAFSSRVDELIKNAIADVLEHKFAYLKESLCSHIEWKMEKMCGKFGHLPENLRTQIQDLIHDTLSKTTFVSTIPTKI